MSFWYCQRPLIWIFHILWQLYSIWALIWQVPLWAVLFHQDILLHSALFFILLFLICWYHSLRWLSLRLLSWLSSLSWTYQPGESWNHSRDLCTKSEYLKSLSFWTQYQLLELLWLFRVRFLSFFAYPPSMWDFQQTFQVFQSHFSNLSFKFQNYEFICCFQLL